MLSKKDNTVKGKLKLIIGLAITFAVCLTIMELAFGYLYYGKQLSSISESDQRHIRLRENIPNSDINEPISEEAKRNSRIINLPQTSYHLTTDEDGFTNPGKLHDDPDIRIFFVGGSTTECKAIPEKKRFPYLVGRILEDRAGKKINSFNAGVSGSHALHSVNALINKILPYSPDYVVLMNNANDLILLPNGTYWDAAGDKSMIGSASAQVDVLQDPNALFPVLTELTSRALHRLFGAAEGGENRALGSKQVTIVRTKVESLYSRAIRTFVKLCKIWEIEPILMTQPMLQLDTITRLYGVPDKVELTLTGEPLYDPAALAVMYAYHDLFNRILREIAEEEDVTLIDLTKEFPAEDHRYIYDMFHYNNEGSELAAEIIAREMSRILVDRGDSGSTQVKVLSTTSPQETFLRISNPGKESVHFKLKVNNALFGNEDDIVSEIHRMNDEFPNEPLERKAWRFVKDRTQNGPGVTDKNWQHAPGILLNSIGYGMCDDRASVLAFLWKKLGMQTRVWTLNGHVVPEVQVDGKWHMYDPTYEVYYLNAGNTVASVAEISEKPELVLKGHHSGLSAKGFTALLNRYSGKTADCYATINDNHVSAAYSNQLRPYDLMFKLPPGAVLDYPSWCETVPAPEQNTNSLNSAYCSISIPPGWRGRMDIPLVIHRITGNGKVEVADQHFDIGSEQFNDLVGDRDLFIYRLLFEEVVDTVKITYLINPLFARLENDNKIQIKGWNTAGLEIELVAAGKNRDMDPLEIRELVASVQNADKYMSTIEQLDLPNASNLDDVRHKIHMFFKEVPGCSPEIRDRKLKRVEQMLPIAFEEIGAGTRMKEFIEAWNDKAYFAVFVSTLEHANSQQIKQLIRQF